jgi:hypothetical protein
MSPSTNARRVVCVGVFRISSDRRLERRQRRLVEPPVVERLAVGKEGDRAVRIGLAGLAEPLDRGLDAASRLLRHPELHQRRRVPGIDRDQRLELVHRLVVVSERGVGPAELPARIGVVRREAQALLQLGHAAVVVPALAPRQLEVVLRELPPRIELERAAERGHCLRDQPLLVVEDAQVVVGAGIGRVDSAGE